VLLFILACFTQQQANASQPIEVNITSDEASGLGVIHTQTAFDILKASLHKILLAITGYSDLHPWIVTSTLVGPGDQDGREFLSEFNFPRPVRHRWSHKPYTGKVRMQSVGTR